MLHVGKSKLAQAQWVGGVKTVFFLQFQKSKAFVQITLDGAQVDPEFLDQRMRIKFFASVEATQDFGQPVGNGVWGAGLAGHGACLVVAWGCMSACFCLL